jgi:valyl-tRNA synthetase
MSDQTNQQNQAGSTIPEIFLKPYDPAAHETNIYKMWEESGYFNPDNLPGERTETFSIVMPPPNANASLHAGHALFVTVEDIMIRFERMRGKKALWLPGSDHAGFETQAVYEKHLQKQKRSRFDMTNEELRSEIWDFVQENKAIMEDQVRSLGASCDWSRELFTLDARSVKIVHDTFKQLEEDELLYRGARPVNWCPKHQTSFSNLEVEHDERVSKFYYFQYGPFVIGTSRPETKFGDKYVVMHPDDARYAEYEHGQKIELEWINGPISATVIKDEAGDPEMGSGVMTITPWHSHVDFDIAKRHDLDYEQIIDWRGKLMSVAGAEFEGMNINDAREVIVKKLDEKGLLVKIDEAYNHSVPCCYKCNKEIEPQIREQWFVKTKPLAKKALEAVANKDVTFVTERDERVFKHWMENIEDWPIARQIAWGIPIPAKVCTECGHGMVDLDDSITKCTKCDGAVEQDPDTFDTWFSSGQWPLATTDFPNGDDFKEYYPTSVMETGKDIIFFWVARMIMLGLYRTGEVPFKKVYLHGMVRDKKGVKMSKSKGNVIAPKEIQDRFGTDALRMGLMVNNTPGSDMNLDPDKVNAYKKFANKIWNITRFSLDNLEGLDMDATLTESDATNLENELSKAAADITDQMNKDRFDLAAEKLYAFVWDYFASTLIEESKELLASDNVTVRASRQRLLAEYLVTSLKMLHPFMPFVTEAIWQELPSKLKDQDILMVAKWPTK